MNPRMALVLAALQSFVFGVPLLLVPAEVLAFSGIAAQQDSMIAIARGAGATVVGLGVINWMSRQATGGTLRALLVGNLCVQVLSLLVNCAEVLAGHLPIQAVSASLLHLAMSGTFVMALRSARSSA